MDKLFPIISDTRGLLFLFNLSLKNTSCEVKDLQITVNGKEEMLKKALCLAEFIESKGLNPETIIVEHNGEIVKKQEWTGIVLQENDCLEVLNFVGGG